MMTGPAFGFAIAVLVISAAGFFTGFRVIPFAPRAFGIIRASVGAIRGVVWLAVAYWVTVFGIALAEILLGRELHAGMALLAGSAVFCVSCRAHTHSKWMRAAAEIGDALAASEARTYDLKFLAAHYRVSRHRGDTWTRTYLVHAKSTTIALKGFAVGVDDASSPMRVFENVGIATWTKDGLVLPVSARGDKSGRQWNLHLLFSQPMRASEERLLYVAGAWRGTWDGLRKTGKDVGAFTVQNTVDVLEVAVMLPRGLNEKDFALEPVDRPSDEESDLRFDHQHRKPMWIWTVRNAKADKYTYRVTVTDEGRKKLGWYK